MPLLRPRSPELGAYIRRRAERRRRTEGQVQGSAQGGMKKVDFNTAYFIHAYNPAEDFHNNGLVLAVRVRGHYRARGRCRAYENSPLKRNHAYSFRNNAMFRRIFFYSV